LRRAGQEHPKVPPLLENNKDKHYLIYWGETVKRYFEGFNPENPDQSFNPVSPLTGFQD
jgi:hypothetical protein